MHTVRSADPSMAPGAGCGDRICWLVTGSGGPDRIVARVNIVRLTEAVVFVWLGMVLAISFMEAPLKFYIPGVSRQVALRIGRVVFLALNAYELLFAVVLSLLIYSPLTPPPVDAACGVPVVALLIQLLLVRPVLARRSHGVIAGPEAPGGPRSAGHYVYVALEVIKVIGLITAGYLLLGT